MLAPPGGASIGCDGVDGVDGLEEQSLVHLII